MYLCYDDCTDLIIGTVPLQTPSTFKKISLCATGGCQLVVVYSLFSVLLSHLLHLITCHFLHHTNYIKEQNCKFLY